MKLVPVVVVVKATPKKRTKATPKKRKSVVVKTKCKATTKKGHKCPYSAKYGDFCGIHKSK